MGDSFYFVIFAFMVLKVTGSAAFVGFVGALEALPYLFLSAYAGVVADRIDRRKVMLFSDLASGSILLLFGLLVFLTGQPPVWTMIVTAVSLSVMRVFFLPAKGAALPALVPSESVLAANSVSQATQSIMPLIGLAVSGGVLGALYAISPQWFFLSAVLLNATSFLGSAVFIAKLPAIVPDREAVHEVHPWEDMKEGLRYVGGRHELLALLLLQLLLCLTLSPFFVVYLSANKEWFGNLPQNLAWFEFAFFSGMVSSSMLIGRLKIRRVGMSYIFGTFGIGAAVAGMGLMPGFWMFVLWNVLAGLAVPFCQIPVQTYLQVSVPDAYRGRVNSALTTVSMGVQPVGTSMGGLLVQGVGLIGAFLSMGAGMCAASLMGLVDTKFRSLTMGEPAVERVLPDTEMATEVAC